MWHNIIEREIQEKPTSFSTAFEGNILTNDIQLGLIMLVFNSAKYILIGYLHEKYGDKEYKFYKVPIKNMSDQLGAAIVNVTKIYDGLPRLALNNVTIDFRRNYITCLLGRNGAGKSTIIKLLTGETLPTCGEVYLPSNYNYITGDEAKEWVGLCPQGDVLLSNVTALEHLYLYASIKLDRHCDHGTEVRRIMSSLNLGEYAYFKSQHLSGGYRRRLNIGIAFIGNAFAFANERILIV